MGYQQQCRFCGIVRKKKGDQRIITHPSLGFYNQISDNLTYFSDLEGSDELIVDGALPVDDCASIKITDLNSYSGNWALAFLNQGKLTFARDKIGIRAIYYFENEDYFCFANEIKSLLALDFVPFKVSQSAAFRFLFLNENDVLGDSLFEGIEELEPGHYLEYDLKQHVYKRVKYHKSLGQDTALITDLEASSSFIKTQMETIIKDVIKSSDNGAALLSGGIDSSSIAAALYINGDHLKIPFCTAITDDQGFDELEFAGEVVKHFGIQDWHQIVAESVEKEAENLHLSMELPTFSLGSMLQYELMRFAKHYGIEYYLDGTGADALFGGHNYYKAVYWNSLMKKGSFSKLLKEVKHYRKEGFWPSYYIRNLMKYSIAPNLNANLLYKVELQNNSLLNALCSDFVTANEDLLKVKRGRKMSDLNDFLQDDFYFGSVRKLLRFLDRFGKQFGVVNRSIFAENASFYEYALRIDPKLKIHNDQLKYVLRYAFKDYLPVKILNRDDKKGLVAPNNRWIKENKDLFMSYFEQDLSMYFDMKDLRKRVSLMIDGMTDVEDYKLFKFISFAIWHKVFQEKYGS